jgi:hypothetical protein
LHHNYSADAAQRAGDQQTRDADPGERAIVRPRSPHDEGRAADNADVHDERARKPHAAEDHRAPKQQIEASRYSE